MSAVVSGRRSPRFQVNMTDGRADGRERRRRLTSTNARHGRRLLVDLVPSQHISAALRVPSLGRQRSFHFDRQLHNLFAVSCFQDRANGHAMGCSRASCWDLQLDRIRRLVVIARAVGNTALFDPRRSQPEHHPALTRLPIRLPPSDTRGTR